MIFKDLWKWGWLGKKHGEIPYFLYNSLNVWALLSFWTEGEMRRLKKQSPGDTNISQLHSPPHSFFCWLVGLKQSRLSSALWIFSRYLYILVNKKAEGIWEWCEFQDFKQSAITACLDYRYCISIKMNFGKSAG